MSSDSRQMSDAQGAATDGQRSSDAAKKAADAYTTNEKSPLSTRDPGSKPGITFAAQDKLPKLPLPDLESSLTKYLTALAPLQSPKDHRESDYAIKEFLRADGPKLQEKLQQYAQGKANYIEQFCK